MTTTPPYIIRPFVPDDTGEILRLLKVGLGTSEIPRSLEFWNWKHVFNPFGPSVGMVAEADGQIVGLRIFMRWKWKSLSNEIYANRAVDTVTHPDWRGKGIFSVLTRRLLEEVKAAGASFVFNTPNQFSMPGYLKLGWQKVVRVPIWIHPIKPISCFLSLIGARTERKQEKTEQNTTQSLSNNPIRDWISETRTEERLHTVRSARYLLWRYTEIPAFQYEAKWRSTGSSTALILFRKKIRRGLQELSLSEVLPSEKEGSIQLCSQLIKEAAKESGADYMVALAQKRTPEAEVLRQSGFIRIGTGPVLIVNQLNNSENCPDILDWSNWRCSIGDLELF